MAFAVDNEEIYSDINIKVVGVGGGGGNALNCMATEGIFDVEFVAVNTDAAALRSSKASTKVQIGEKLTRGRGAGNKPEIGERSAQENRDEIAAALKGATMVFIAAGMGGGTGTGAAPVVAEVAKEMDILTVAVVTKPFNFEQKAKMVQAERGIGELMKHVDSLVVIPNERLISTNEKPLTMKESFSLADNILKTGVKSIAELITVDGFINLDFADVETTMKNAGYAHMAIGHGSGKDKAAEAANAVITSPLLETSISGATRLLVNIVMSEDALSTDIDTATKLITEAADPDVELIFGASFDENLQDEISLTVIASGFKNMEGVAGTVIKADEPKVENGEPGVEIPKPSSAMDDYNGLFEIFNSRS
ncbi:MAG: cell division protein FtsZ [Oscillospiraceae bacterium]|nr:cell division protein FtsZ [Oscillospiraceae bacterium]